MIAVVADDLSGAAEMAGIGWRFGLKVELFPSGSFPESTSADLIVFDTDTRLAAATRAKERVGAVCDCLNSMRPGWVYKKVDSVLRGNVVEEIRVMQAKLGIEKCLLAPANPKAGRTIRHGRYYIGGRPLNYTDFRNDPVHPRCTALVQKLLSSDTLPKPTILRRGSTSVPRGIGIGPATSTPEMRHWARVAQKGVLPAGGAEYFETLLEERCKTVAALQQMPAPTAATLFVCGSISDGAVAFIERCRTAGWPTLLVPADKGSRGDRAWAAEAVAALRKARRGLMGIGPPRRTLPGESERLMESLTEAAALALRQGAAKRVCVEGGATAAVLIRKLGYRKLTVTREYATGVTGLQGHTSPRVEIVVKPGSYAWPEILLI